MKAAGFARRRVVVAIAAIPLALGAWWATHRQSTDERVDDSKASDTQAASSTSDVASTADVDSIADNAAERVETRALALFGRITDASGVPVASVQVQWSSLWDGDLGPSGTWGWIDWQAAERDALSVESAADGTFRFESAPQVGPERARVLRARKAGYCVEILPLDSTRDERASVDVRLQPTRGLLVRVIDAAGGPVANAEIAQLGLAAPKTSQLDLALQRAYRLSRSTQRSNADGTAHFAPLRGRQLFFATHGAQASSPVECSDVDQIELTLPLEPTFRAAGRVDIEAGSANVADARIRYWTVAGERSSNLGQVELRADLTWGPVDVPVVAVDQYAFEICGAGLVPQTRTFPRPSPGESLQVDFRTQVGVARRFFVSDADTGAPIVDAEVSIMFLAGPNDWRRAQQRTDAQGRAVVSGCLDESAYISARASRYVGQQVGPISLFDVAADLVFELERAGRVAGRVVSAGVAVPAFEVIHWKTDPHPVNAQTFKDAVGGSFELSEVPLGTVTLMASAGDHAPSAPVSIEVKPDETALVELELPQALRGVGRVVAAAGHGPVTTATVQAWTSFGDKLLTRRGAATRVDRDGHFELSGLARGDNRVMFEADGYATKVVWRHVASQVEVDFGTIALERRQRLDVRLLAGQDFEFTGCSLSLDGEEHYPAQQFSASGLAAFDAVAPGSYSVQVSLPGGELLTSRHFFRNGEPWAIEIDARGEAALEVEVVDRKDGGTLTEATVLLSERTAGGLDAERYADLDAKGEAHFTGLSVGSTAVSVLAPDGGTIGSAIVELARGVNRVRVVIGDDVITLQVVDGHATPISDAQVWLFSPTEQPGWRTWLRTDVKGLARASAPRFRALTASVSHPAHGWSSGLAVDIDSARRTTATLVLAPRKHIRVALRDGMLALAGVEFRVRDASGQMVDLRQFSDENGLCSYGPVNAAAHVFSIADASCWPVERAIDPVEDGEVAIELQVRRLGSLVIRVSGAVDQQPAATVPVALRSLEFGTDVDEWVAQGRAYATDPLLRTDAEGTLRLDGLPHGAYHCVSANAIDAVVIVPPHSVAETSFTVR